MSDIRSNYKVENAQNDESQIFLVNYFKKAYADWVVMFDKIQDIEKIEEVDFRLTEINTIILGFMDQIQKHRGAIYINELAAVFTEILNYYQAVAEAKNSPTQGQSLN